MSQIEIAKTQVGMMSSQDELARQNDQLKSKLIETKKVYREKIQENEIKTKRLEAALKDADEETLASQKKVEGVNIEEIMKKNPKLKPQVDELIKKSYEHEKLTLE